MRQQSQHGIDEDTPTLLTPGVGGRPRKRSGKGALIGVIAALLVIVLIGVILFSLNLIKVPGLGGSSVTQAPIKSTSINSTLTYAGVDITVLNAQQATNFADDPNTKTDGMLRLNLQEQNNLKETVNYLYSQSAHLVLPDRKSVV